MSTLRRRSITPRALGALTILSLLLVAGGAVIAQSAAGVISGQVIDADRGTPIAGAVVALTPSGASATSGSDGRYTITQLTAGVYTLTCQAPGYRPVTERGFKLAAGGSRSYTCRLRATAKADSRAGRGRAAADKDEAAAPAEPMPGPAPGRAAPASPSKPQPMRRAKVSASGGTVGGAYAPMRNYGPPQQAAIIARPPAQPQPEQSREGYEARDENPFLSPSTQPLSTFSIDVDTASYSNMRRFIEREGRLPPKDAVKIEELINYFSYSYPAPTGDAPFAIHTEISMAPWNTAHRLVSIGLKGKDIATDRLPAANLVFLIDVSGSMNSPDKLPLLKRAFSLLVNELRPQDRVAIVVYAGAAGVVLPPTAGTAKDSILLALDRLEAGGSTAGSAGIQLAYDVARQNFVRGGNNRVILATDGDFNVGPSSDAELVRLIEEKRKEGIFLTVLGFGTGNYQDAKMEKLADKGNGNHAYIDSILEAQKVLVSEMGGTLFTIAKDVKLQIEFNPAKVKAYRLLGYENRMLAAQDFNDDQKDAGELGAGHTVTALYEIIPAGSSEAVPGVDELKYQKTQATSAASANELMTIKLRYKAPDGDQSKLIVHPLQDRPTALENTSADFRFATAVAELGLILRDSEHKGKASFERLIARARSALGKDKNGYREAFITLAQKAEALYRGR